MKFVARPQAAVARLQRITAALFRADNPRFTGYIAYRGIVPSAALPAGSIDPPSCLSTGPDRSFARYLIRDGRFVNFVGLAQRDDWREEGWSIPATTEEVLAEYVGWHENVTSMIRAAPAGALFTWALFDREPLQAWSRGRVALMGDAAHPMLPFLGQGAGMGIEDAIVLARAFADATDPDLALRRYQDARLERSTWVMLESRKAGLAYHSGSGDSYRPAKHVTAESLGIWGYNPLTAPI